MAKTTFWNIIELTIKKAGTPLSAMDIWLKAKDLGTLGDYVTTVRLPGQQSQPIVTQT